MKKNVGALDRGIRIVAALALLSIIFVGPKSLWGLVGIPLLITGITGMCPPYSWLGISTCRKCNK